MGNVTRRRSPLVWRDLRRDEKRPTAQVAMTLAQPTPRPRITWPTVWRPSSTRDQATATAARIEGTASVGTRMVSRVASGCGAGSRSHPRAQSVGHLPRHVGRRRSERARLL